MGVAEELTGVRGHGAHPVDEPAEVRLLGVAAALGVGSRAEQTRARLSARAPFGRGAIVHGGTSSVGCPTNASHEHLATLQQSGGSS